MKTKTKIIATTSRKENGWCAVLEFPNGGRQVMAPRYGSMDSAQRYANKCLRVRLAYPNSCIVDPQENQCVEL